MGIDRPPPIVAYSERQGLFRRVTYSLFPGKVLLRAEWPFHVLELYVGVTEFAEGHTDRNAAPFALALFLASLAVLGAAAWFALSGRDGSTAFFLGITGFLCLVWSGVRVQLSGKKIRELAIPGRGIALTFRLHPERKGEIEAFIRAVMKERERMLREGPTVPLGPKERLNAAQRLLRLKELMDGGFITPDQFERFKEMTLKAP
ncbi:MAG: hypothetical protein N3A38_12370 [Planctomycetota bacterium]|nr:hypothetical protein [Planctomycetota bacterium]